MKQNLKTAAWLFVLALAVYSAVAWERLAQPSPHFHFVDLAHSFLEGRLDTDTPKQRRKAKAQEDDPRGWRDAIERSYAVGGWNDWAQIKTLTLKHPLDLDEDGVAETSVVRGKFPWGGDAGEKRHLFHTTNGYELKIVVPKDLARTCGERGNRPCNETTHYVSFPPMPAVVLMPFVAVWGYDVHDTLIALVAAAMNVSLLFLLLQLLVVRGHSTRTTRENVWLTILFAFGTVFFFSAVQGTVWFVALVYGVTLNLLYIMAALDLKHPILAGLLLGLGVATRVPIAFCVVFFAWQLFFPGNKWRGDRWGEILKTGALFAAPVLVVGVGLMLYNHARFDSYGEFGHSFLTGGAATRIRDNGMFSTFYLNLNLSSAITNMPRLVGEAPYFMISKHGVGLLFTTPLLLLLARPRRMPALNRALWLTVIVTALPGLFYQNSGWEQFGYRFALDYFPYLLLLLALGGRPITRWVKLGIAWCILVNLFGAITFGRAFEGLSFYY